MNSQDKNSRISGLLWNHIKHTIRKIRIQKNFAVMNIFGLAVGMACFIVAALWLSYELSYDQFHENKDRIFEVSTETEKNITISHSSFRLGPELKKKFPEIEEYCRIRFNNASLFQRGDLRHHEQAFYLADPSIFNIFTFPFKHGDPDTALSGENSIILTESTAARYFGNDNPIGKTLHVLQFKTDFKITGVIYDIPENSHIRFDLIARIEWIGQRRMESWEASGSTYVLLSREASIEKLNQSIKNFMKDFVDPDTSQNLVLRPLTRVYLQGSEVRIKRKQVFVYSFMAIIVLILACINFMNLSTAGSINRAKEIGVRKVNGATRNQIVNQCLIESIFFSFLAIIFALLLAQLFLPAVNQLLGRNLSLINLTNSRLLFIVIAIVPVTGFIAGGYPAFFLSSFSPSLILKGNFRPDSSGLRFRKILITFQFSISIGLIICSLIVFKQLRLFREANPGINRNSVIMIPNDKRLLARFDKFKEKLLKDPEILSVTAASSRPALVREEVFIRQAETSINKTVSAAYTMVDFDFFKTFEMEIIQGRSFINNAAEDKTGTCIINESAARELGIHAPIGRLIYFDHPGFAESYKTLRIIGVVKDFHFRSMHQTIEPFIFRFYRPLHLRIYIKISPEKIQNTLKRIELIFQEFEPNSPFIFEFLNNSFNELYESEIRLGRLFIIFGIITILISCIGLFGLASYSTELKIKEIGVRKVLGASVSGLVFVLSRQFTSAVMLANIFTWPVVYIVMERWLQNYAYRINIGLDVFILSALITQLIAVIPVSVKAARAASANPVNSLRNE